VMIMSNRQKIISKLSNGLILDIGFNQNPNPFLDNVIGIDLIVDKCPDNYKQCIKLDALEFTEQIKEKFDTIVLGEIAEHVENPSRLLRECYKGLKNDGILIVTVPNPYFIPYMFFEFLLIKNKFYDDSHLNMFPPRIFEKLLNYCGFECTRMIGVGILPVMLSQQIIFIAKKKLD
jgi:SAM-dependent methyltransferase